jgi:outer membrane immunogenic protein
MRKFEIEVAVVALAALVSVNLVPVSASADEKDVTSTRVQTLEKQLAAINRENELLREIKAARALRSTLSKGEPVASGEEPKRPGKPYAADRAQPSPATKPGRATEAYAADLSTKAPIYRAEPFADPSSWGGFYLGLGIGSRWTQADASVTSVNTNGFPVPITDPGSTRFDSASFRVSPYLGYNWQVSNWVLGVEGDWGWAEGRTRTLAGMAYPSLDFLTSLGGFTPQNGGDSFSFKSTWDASLRARVGYAIRPDILLYATGGPAWLHVESTSTCSHGTGNLPCAILPPFGQLLTPLNITDSATRLGWTLGGGIEAMLGSNWIARAEYRYASFGTIHNIDNRTTTPAGTTVFGGVVPAIVGYDLRLATQTVTFGLSYKFGSYGPVTARY